MKSAWLKVVLMFALLASLSVSVQAGDLSWQFQFTGIQNTGGNGVAVAMRGGNVWPVVFSSGESAMLLATGWYNLGYDKTGGNPVAASSSKGQVAAAGGNDYGFHGVVSSPSGWQGINAAAVSFDTQGRLWSADLYGNVFINNSLFGNINPDNSGMGYQSIDIDVNASGTVGVAVNNGGTLGYFNYDPLIQEWVGGNVENYGMTFSVNAQVSMAFDGLGRPNIAFQDSSTLFVADFNIQTGQWGYTYGQSLDTTGRTPIECSNEGTLGIAYVSGGELYYMYKEIGGTWTRDRINDQFIGNVNTGEVGLAYDYEGIPVVAFVGGGNEGQGVYLAYDPVVVPEPATISLLGLGVLTMWRRRK